MDDAAEHPEDTESNLSEEGCLNYIQEDGQMVPGRCGGCFNCQREAEAS